MNIKCCLVTFSSAVCVRIGYGDMAATARRVSTVPIIINLAMKIEELPFQLQKLCLFVYCELRCCSGVVECCRVDLT